MASIQMGYPFSWPKGMRAEDRDPAERLFLSFQGKEKTSEEEESQQARAYLLLILVVMVPAVLR